MVKIYFGRAIINSHLTDIDGPKPEIGMPVEMVTRKIRNDGDEKGMIVYSNKYRPVLAGPQ